MRILPALLCASLAMGSAVAAPPTISDFSKGQQAEIRQFAANNSLFVLYHEMGHLLFDQLQIPILGREEDAADNMATWVLLNHEGHEAEKVLSDAADGWLLSGVAYESGAHEEDFAAAHSLDKQRAYQIVCMMVGKDEKAFGEVATQYALARDRQDSCYWEYQVMANSFSRLVGNRAAADGSQNSTVHVTYHSAGGKLRKAADAFRSSGIFDQVADELRENFRLPREIKFNAQSCGEANAFYDANTVEIIFCYELMQDYMDLYAAELPNPRFATDESERTGKSKVDS